MMTSSIMAGSISDRLTKALSTDAARSAGCTLASRPLRRAPAVRLYGIVDDPKCPSRTCHFDHRNLQARALVPEFIHAVGGLQTQQPRHFEVTPRLCHSLFPHRVFGDGLAKRNTRHQPLDHEF